MYGNGIYFADNSNYCLSYSFTKPDGLKQLFFTFVVVGESISLNPDSTLTMPPKKDDMVSHYDSVRNANSTHFIVYDYNKQYPGYILTFK